MEPDRDEALAALDDVTLRRIAYGRDDFGANITREQASRELAAREETLQAGMAGSTANVPSTPSSTRTADEDEGAELGDDDRPTPWWTRARKLTALAFAASLVVGTAVGVGADRVADALAPASLDVFDRPSTDEERAAVAAMSDVGVVTGTDLGEVREIASVGEVTVYAHVRAAGSSTPRDNLGEQVCLVAIASETDFFFPECVPTSIFERQGVALTLSIAISGGSTTPEGPARSIAVRWGPSGGADVRVIENVEAP